MLRRVLAILALTTPVAYFAIVQGCSEETPPEDLCNWIRENKSRSLRIVLRTGQAGAAPEEKVLNEYDIDYYLSKAEVTEKSLYNVVRAGLRSSLDLETLRVVGEQLKNLAGEQIGTVGVPLALPKRKVHAKARRGRIEPLGQWHQPAPAPCHVIVTVVALM